VCSYFLAKGESIDFYHVGLDFDSRKAKQLAWQSNKTKIIVATNAFGMGIDKSNVRFVLHHDIPDSLEAYFQEAGRAGRDEKSAESILFYEKHDVENLRNKVKLKYPEIEHIKRIYTALGNHFQLAIGSGKGESFVIDLNEFSDKYDQSLIVVYNALKFLEVMGYIQLLYNPSRLSKIKFLSDPKMLYNYQLKDDVLDKIIQFILRTHIGIFDDHISINEFKVSQKLGISQKELLKKLTFLHKNELVDYQQSSKSPKVLYLRERLDTNHLSFPVEFYHNRKKINLEKMEKMIGFLLTESCKNRYLLSYFGENDSEDCGRCNNCRNKIKNSSRSNSSIMDNIKELLKDSGEHQMVELISKLGEYPKPEIIGTIRWLSDHKQVEIDPSGIISLPKKKE